MSTENKKNYSFLIFMLIMTAVIVGISLIAKMFF